MRTIELLDEPPSINEVLKLAGKEDIILRSLDGQEFVLAEIDDFNREIELTRQNQRLMKFLEERSKETKTFTLKQVKQQLA